MINRKFIKPVITLIIMSFLLTACGKKAGETVTDVTTVDTEAEEEDITVSIDKALAVAAGKREESVSIKTDPNGKVKEVKSEVLISDLKKGKPVKDTAKLKDIRNKVGDEELSQDGDIVYWENKGEDITYEGTYDGELPFSVKITYYLDGKETSPKEMAGKSGKAKIRFDYKNKTSRKVKSEGKEYEVNVPLAFISAVALDSEKFKNIKVENGKLTSLEGQTMAIGYTFPGLKKSLKLDTFGKDINVSDFVEITADVTEFELDFTVTMVTSGLFKDIDTASINDAKDLSDNMKDLGDASGELADAADKLASGAGTFGTALNQYVSGMGQLNSGAKQLRDGLGTLDSNTAALVDGASKLNQGLMTLDQALSNVDTSGGGFSETDVTNLKTAITGLATDAGEMAGSIGALQQSLAGLKTELEAIGAENPDIDTSSVMTNVNALQGSLGKMNTNVTLLQTSLQNISASASGMQDMMKGLEDLKPTISTLASASGELSSGISSYGQGVSAAYSGSKELASGTEKLSGAGGQLTSGYGTLASGIRSYASGMHTFDDEGIKELSELAGDDLGTVIEQVKAVKVADEEFKTFSGDPDFKGESTVRFVIESDAIEME